MIGTELLQTLRAQRASDAVVEALSDDLNTPQMIASLHSLRNIGSVRDCRKPQ